MKVFLDTFESFVGVNFFTMIFAWVNLLILYIFLKKLLFKPVKNMIDSRQKEIDGMYDKAEESVEIAEKNKQLYEEKIKAAEEESDEILRTAQRKAKLREEEILKEAKAQADRTLERAKEQVELEKKRAVNEVKDQVGSIAIDIAKAVIERDINEDEHKALIDSFIDNIGEEND